MYVGYDSTSASYTGGDLYSWNKNVYTQMEDNDTLFFVNGSWLEWNETSNPDENYPWSWDFNFPPGTMNYYEFFSVSQEEDTFEEFPDEADARCSYRNQSKIVNTGTTNISGYLLIRVDYWNTTSESWELANETINETNPRIINISEQLGLDTIFNGLVNSSNLFGDGTYRVYAALRDPEFNVLICDDETKIEASYEFTISSS